MKPLIDRAVRNGHKAKAHEAMPDVPMVRWRSRGSGVTYSPLRTSRRAYFGMKLNRVAERMISEAPQGASRLIVRQ